MKKRKKGKKLKREAESRKSLLYSLSESLIEEGKIKTTEAKAKALQPVVEKFITRAKKENSKNRRYLERFFNEETVEKFFDVGEDYKNREGGYTRVIKLPPRKSDSAKQAVIELV